jgi:biopolymer transport protein ExbB/TolQ
MFAGKTMLEIFQIGGFTMYILAFCSFVSATVFLERMFYYRRLSRTKRLEFMAKIRRALKSGDIEKR